MTQQEENHKRVMIPWYTQSETAMAFAAQDQPAMVEGLGCKICDHYDYEEAACY